jgi:hypothetical protein
MPEKRFLQNLERIEERLRSDTDKPLGRTFALDDYFDWLEADNLKHGKNLIPKDKLPVSRGGKAGVLNPYAVASIVLKKEISKVSSHDLIKAMKIIQKGHLQPLAITREENVVVYKDIFNPAKSPIFNTIDLSEYTSNYKPAKGKVIATNFTEILGEQLVKERALRKDRQGKKVAGNVKGGNV